MKKQFARVEQISSHIIQFMLAFSAHNQHCQSVKIGNHINQFQIRASHTDAASILQNMNVQTTDTLNNRTNQG